MEPLHVKTPYQKSDVLSKCGPEVYMKLDLLQASGSFKDRGMLRLCQEHKKNGVTKLVSSSGGNAGLAVAYSGKRLGLKAHVVVPTTTKRIMVEKIIAMGATAQIHGENWNAADELARKLATEPGTAYCHPFDHPMVWTGHSSIIDEIKEQGPKPDAIICAVGGGGLMAGLLEGLKRNGWDDVEVLAVEAKGAESLHKAMEAGKLVALPAITSICTSMGALKVAEGCFERAKEGKVSSVVVEDKQAVAALLSFADDHRYVLLWGAQCKQDAGGAVLCGITVVVLRC